MRPQSIVNFERVVILNVLLGIVGSWLNWDKMMAVQRAQLTAQGQTKAIAMLPTLTLTIAVVFIFVWLLLVWLIARKGSVVAKWIYVVVAALTLLGAVVAIARGTVAAYGTLPMVFAIVGHLLTIVALWLLFRPDSKAWFSEGRAADPADFR